MSLDCPGFAIAACQTVPLNTSQIDTLEYIPEVIVRYALISCDLDKLADRQFITTARNMLYIRLRKSALKAIDFPKKFI